MLRSRFRLPDHVIARRHVVSRAPGSEESFILLHDQGDRGPRTLSIGEREWALIDAMDGTRDLQGLLLAARAAGASMTEEHARAFVSELHREALIVDLAQDASDSGEPKNLATSKVASDKPAPITAASRPIEQLPGFRLSCDGRGSCCRLYPSILFSPLDAARARAALPMVRGAGEDEARAFMPERGVRREALAVTLVNGRCAYLGDDGYCGVHSAAGSLAKPLGCRLFPAAFIDDGISVRVTPAVECACVLRTDPEREGETLVDASMTDTSGLDPRIYVDVLPERITVSDTRSVERAHYVAWSRAIEEAPVHNAVAGLLSLADLLSENGEAASESEKSTGYHLPSTVSARDALAVHEANDPLALIPSLHALRARAASRADEKWRSEADLARISFVALVSAADLAIEALDLVVAPAPLTLASESLYVRAGFFGHQWVSRSLRMPLSSALRDRAVRIVLGRALSVVAAMGELDDPVFAAPLALVEALMRGHGLGVYVRDL